MTEKKENDKERTDSNEIFVGNKHFMKYVVAAMMQLKKEGSESAIIKARGKFISRAVDIAEVTKKRMKDTENKMLKHSVEIGTDEFKSEDEKMINISTISITLKK